MTKSKTLITLTLVAVLTLKLASSNSQSITSKKDKANFNLPAIDAYSTSRDQLSSDDFKNVKQKELIKFFLPYYDKHVCEPGNYSHSVYQQYMKKGENLLQEAKAEWVARLKNG